MPTPDGRPGVAIIAALRETVARLRARQEPLAPELAANLRDRAHAVVARTPQVKKLVEEIDSITGGKKKK